MRSRSGLTGPLYGGLSLSLILLAALPLAAQTDTAYGTCVLHVSPESWIGGPLALVEDGDLISLDAGSGKLDLLVPDSELESRRARWVKHPRRYERGYMALYNERVTQAHRGCDFDFLDGNTATPEPEIH